MALKMAVWICGVHALIVYLNFSSSFQKVGKLESRPAVSLSASSRGRWVQRVISSGNTDKNNIIYFTHEALS